MPNGLGIGQMAESLSPRFGLAQESKGQFQQTFFDTFDGRLHGLGQSLVQQNGRLSLMNGTGYSEIAGDEWRRAKEKLLVSDLPAGILRSQLASFVDVRALTQLVRIQGRRRIYRVTDGQGKTVVRLVLEEPRLAGDGGALQPRLRLVGVRGYDRDLERVASLIGKRLRLSSADVTVQDEAVTRTGGTPGGCAWKGSVELRR